MIFPWGWISSIRRNQVVPKPASLDLNQQYLCTNAKTILAFIVCSISNPGQHRTSYFPDGLQFGDSSVEIMEKNDVLVAHLKGTIHQNLTKKTVEGILAGYPSWYRESLTMRHGPVVPYPIPRRDDVFRAGRVVAVGLGENELLPLFLSHDKLNDKPIKRVWEILKYKLKPQFSTDTNLGAAREAVDYLWRLQTASGAGMYLTDNLCHDWSRSIPLNGHEYIFAMVVFNEYNMLTEQEKEKLKPIFLPVIWAAFRRAHKVIEHLSHKSRRFSIPDFLRDLGRPVFLRDCNPS